MKSMVRTLYGSPDVLNMQEVDVPPVHDNGVLVRVRGTSINAGDWHLLRGTPLLIRLVFKGLFKPKIQILGGDISGMVEKIGKDVTQFKIGDEVFGELSESGFGAFAEYACCAEKALTIKPHNLTFEKAATVPVAALSALQALRDCAGVQKGQKILIVGASGGVGSFAVQIAKSWGAEVTAVCSTAKIEMMKTIGADHIIDSSQLDVTKSDKIYDAIIDAAALKSVFSYFSILKNNGNYVLVGGSTPRLFFVMLFGPLISKLKGRNVKSLISKPVQSDLAILRNLIEARKLVPFIDRTYPLSEIADTIRQVGQRQVRGKIAISV